MKTILDGPKIWTELVTDITTGQQFVIHVEMYVPKWRIALNAIGLPVELKQKEIIKLLPYGK